MSLIELFSDELEALVQRVAPGVVAIDHQRGHGTGLCISADGLVLTNAHVVHGASSVRVRFHDGNERQGEVLGRDTLTDLAVVKTGVPSTQLVLAQEAQVKVGQLVLALGHPFGFERSVSLGVVSALERRLPGRDGASLDGLIQTDAAINPGNSGGPLLNVRGQVVGINTAMLPFAQGLGFAVPASTASWVSALLIRHREVRRRYLGISAKNEIFPAEVAQKVGQARGVRIVDIGPQTPAAEGGLEARDLVISVGNSSVATIDELQRGLAFEVDQVVDLTVYRNERTLHRQVRPQRSKAR